jgi:release factor glutamine methyltransferase
VEDLSAMLRRAGIADPRRVATDIVAALLQVPRSWPVINRETSVDAAVVRAAHAAALRLSGGAPFAYAVGTAAFRNLTLAVDERVLIPRPETEMLVECVLERMRARSRPDDWGNAVDIGTGSGAIALSLAAEGHFSRIVATDASADALDVACANRERCGSALSAHVEFRHGSLIAPVRGMTFSAVISNPPYIAFAEIESVPPDVRDWEPPVALFSGHDGMAATIEIVRDAPSILDDGGLLALEVDERRASLVAELMMRSGRFRDVGVGLDLAGRERFVTAVREARQ